MAQGNMFDFSGDETFCMVVAPAVALLGAVRLYAPLLGIPLLGRSTARRLPLMLLPPIALCCTAIVLSLWADSQVKGHADYVLMFLLLQAAWITLGCAALRLLGISIRGDAIDRNNPAAVTAACGFLAAVSVVFALANVGGGPTIWTTIVPALAGTVLLFCLWLTTELLGGSVAESITVDRDTAGGCRIAGAMLGCGLVLGRAAGGNWISWDQTWRDLAKFGSPAVLIAIAAVVLQRLWKPTIANPRPGSFYKGMLPAMAFLLAGLVIVALTPHGLHPGRW